MIEVDNNDINSILFDISKKIVLPKFKNLKPEEIQFKNKKDLVTVVDVLVENELEKKLKSLINNSLFVGEEKFNQNPEIINNYNVNEYCWTADPIDGTSNYAKGDEKFAIMLSLSFNNEILQSWIYKPINEEFCVAKMNNGTYINNKRIKINENKLASTTYESIGSISNKYWGEVYENKMKKISNCFKKIKSLGCIGYEYVDIAIGNRDFIILSKLYPWDHIPGILIVREAGGYDIHFDNKNRYQHNLEKDNLVVTGSKKMQKKIMELIKE